MFNLNRNLNVLFLINITTSLCRSIVFPLFPLFIKGLGASVLEISLVLFLGGFVSIILVVPSGLLSDRYRRRNILILSSVMSGFATLYFTTIKSWEQSVYGIMLFLSAFSMFFPARQSLIADNIDPSSMATTFSFMNTAWPIGSLIGPIIGGFLADNYGWNYTFYAATLVSLVSIIPTYFFKRTYKGDKRRDKKKTKGTFFTKDVTILLIVFSLFQIFVSVAMGIMDLVVPLYLTKMFNASNTTVGFFLSMGLGLATLIALVPSGILADKYDRKKILAYSILPLPIIILFWPSIRNHLLLMVLYMVIVGFWSMTWSVKAAYIMSFTPILERGLVTSIGETAVSLGFTIGSPIGGYFWHAYSPTAPFYVSAVFFALSFSLILLLKKPE